MGKYSIKKFDTEADYKSALDNMNYPHVAKVSSPYKLHYNKEFEFTPIILYSDKTTGETLDSTKTPIAIQVAPASHFSDGKARYMSLVNMSIKTPDTGTNATGNDYSTNTGAGIMWGYTGLINKFYTKVPGLDLTSYASGKYKIATDLLNYGYLPSDKFKSSKLYPDSYRYSFNKNSNNLTPSPFLVDGKSNPDFIASDTNAFSDINGKTNSTAIIAKQTVAWTGEISNTYAEGNYPAAATCNRFHTTGTAAGDWYLPSIGELIYAGINISAINNILGQISSAVKIGDEDTYSTLGSWLWSSTEYDEGSSWGLNSSDCGASYGGRFDSGDYARVRAFLAL